MLADKLKIINDMQDIKVSYGSALEELKLVKETSAAQIDQLKNENRDLHRENDELVSALEEESDRSRENVTPKPMVYDFSQQTEEMKEFLPPRSTDSPRDSVSGMADKMARVEAMCESYRADILCLTQELKTSKNGNETLYDQFKHLIKIMLATCAKSEPDHCFRNIFCIENSIQGTAKAGKDNHPCLKFK